jgi:phosphatidylglycerophosphatase A
MRLPLLVATAGGAGYFPFAPGTVGSAVGVALYAALWLTGGWPVALAGFVVATALGYWSAGIAEAHLARRDPGPVVIDEVAGQMLSLLFVPLAAGTALAGFLLFRLFDIVKPFPCRRLEKLPGGSGIMTDDLMAGIYANLVLQALVRWAPALLGLK